MSRLYQHIEKLEVYNIKANTPVTEDVEELASFKNSQHFVSVHENIKMKYGNPNRFYDRFLKARDYDFDKVGALITEAMNCRNKNKLDQELNPEEKSELDTLYKELDQLWPVKFWGYTKHGNLIMKAELRNIRTSEIVSRFSEDEIRTYFLWFNELSMKYQAYGNANIRVEGDKSWKQTVEVYDLDGISWRQLLNFKGMRILGNILKLCQKVYPETLGQTFVINAPSFFSIFWSFVRKFLSDDTAQKTEILSKNQIDKAKEFLTQYLDDKDIGDLLGINSA
eukprot:maker-scaffold_1-snap-gene-7.32-mRNA-1 protein AED:0.34 eAED:0.34 QI:57/0.5/0.33/0.66/0.5/0.33/3/0/280